jgi:MOSC domain-containing protein YiiM
MGSRILSIQAGLPRSFEHFNKKRNTTETWTSGIYKHSIGSSVFISKNGIEGDDQADLKFHGGPDRALLIFARAHYPLFESFIGKEIPQGGFGENLTVDYFDEREIAIGDHFLVGNALIEISQPRLPCFKLGRRLESPQIVDEVLQQRKGGIYARVLKEGHISIDDELELVQRPFPEWTASRAMDTYLDADNENRRELGSLPAISELWREKCLS